jgi:hypothetical protein
MESVERATRMGRSGGRTPIRPRRCKWGPAATANDRCMQLIMMVMDRGSFGSIVIQRRGQVCFNRHELQVMLAAMANSKLARHHHGSQGWDQAIGQQSCAVVC